MCLLQQSFPLGCVWYCQHAESFEDESYSGVSLGQTLSKFKCVIFFLIQMPFFLSYMIEVRCITKISIS